MVRTLVASTLALSLLAGCSSRPRDFAPVAAVSATDPAGFTVATTQCKTLLAAGQLTHDGRLASAGVGAAAGATTLAVGSAAASSAGLYGGMAVAGATLVALPFVAIGGAYGLAKAKQKKRERAIQTAMTGCLKERGFEVAGWQRRGRIIPVATKAGTNR